MGSKEIVITIRVRIEADDDVEVEVAGQAPPELKGKAASGVHPGVAEFLREHAPRNVAQHQLELLQRCVDELELSVELPATNTPRTYLNLYPPKRYGAKRAGALETRTGRTDIYCSPTHLKGRRCAEAITNNGVPVAVKVYVTSEEAIDEAIDLIRIGLEER